MPATPAMTLSGRSGPPGRSLAGDWPPVAAGARVGAVEIAELLHAHRRYGSPGGGAIGDVPERSLSVTGHDPDTAGAVRVRRSARASHPAGPSEPRPRGRGVAAGWADRWGVEPTVVRAALGLLTLVGGLGALLYGLAALASTAPAPDDEPNGSAPWPPPLTRRVPPAADLAASRRQLAIGAGTAAILVAATPSGSGRATRSCCPPRRWRSASPLPGRGYRASSGSLGVRGCRASCRSSPGSALLVAGVVSLASRTGGLSNVGASAGAIAVVVGGLAIFAAPAAGRLLRALDDERSARIRDEEQRRPRRPPARLGAAVARADPAQRTNHGGWLSSPGVRKRELRAWLYGTARSGEPASLRGDRGDDGRDRGRSRRARRGRRRRRPAARRAGRAPCWPPSARRSSTQRPPRPCSASTCSLRPTVAS